MPKRFLLLYVEPTPYILGLLHALIAAGDRDYDALFVTADKSQPWAEDARVSAEQVLLRPGRAWANMRSLVRLAGRILAGRYGGAHLAGWGDPVLLLAVACLWLRRVPFSMESDTQLARRRSPKELVKRAVYPLLFRLPRLLFPGGQRQADFFRYYGARDSRIRVARMTADVTRIQALPVVPGAEFRRKNAIAGDEVVFLYAGRLEEHKGIRVLLRAFASLACPDCRLVLTGDGPLRPLVEAESASKPSILCAGRRPWEDVVHWMRASDVLVLPSLFEPWGLVVNEAMACGLPIIASDAVGAVDDLVFDGLNGLVVPAGDVYALQQAMQTLAASPDLRANMGLASSRLIKDWTIENEAEIVRAGIAEFHPPNRRGVAAAGG